MHKNTFAFAKFNYAFAFCLKFEGVFKIKDTLFASKFLIFEKQILWKDVKKVKVQKFEPYGKPLEKHAIITNKQNKVIFTCSYDLVGFDLIVKKAKKKH